MSDSEVLKVDFERKLTDFIVKVLKLGDDVRIDPKKNLVEQIGLDSIEALDAVATLHELLGVPIPDNFNLKSVESLSSLTDYVLSRFGGETARRFLALDLSQMDFSRSEDV